MNKDLISILMPVKDGGAFLAPCLSSIVTQIHTEWELVVVDDHSTDGTWVVLQDFARRDPRIRPLKNNGQGIIPALRLAFDQSKGDFITRMDADDLMVPEKLQLLLNKLWSSDPGTVSTGLVEYFTDGDLGDGFARYQDWLNGLGESGGHYDEIYRECSIPSPCWMMRRSDLGNIGAFDLSTYPEDYDLCFRMYQYGMKVKVVKKVLHQWRDHGLRASRNDPHYADQFFLPLKLQYFLNLDLDTGRQLVLWGAGKKGKRMATMLVDQQIPFQWVTNNVKKTGHVIHGVELKALPEAPRPERLQFVVLVAAPEEQLEITRFLEERKFKKGRDYFFFC